LHLSGQRYGAAGAQWLIVWKRYFVDLPKRTGSTTAGTPTFGPSGAAVWSAPTVDAKRGLLYVTSGDNYSHPATATSDAVLALDLKTGQIMWSVQTSPKDVFNSSCSFKSVNCPEESGPDHDFGASAILVTTFFKQGCAGGRPEIGHGLCA
jgi:polyvinyl alcohol dehydrogenase (cytochrome)